MLRVKVSRKSSTADFVAVPGRSLRFILPGRYLLAVSLIFISSFLFVLPHADFAAYWSSDSKPIQLRPDEQAYILADEKHAQVAPADGNLENYEDFDIPAAQFKVPLQKNVATKPVLPQFEHSLAPSELQEIKRNARALQQSMQATALPVTSADETLNTKTATATQSPSTQAEKPDSDLQPALPQFNGTWYQHTVERGDSLSAIFATLALPPATLNKISAIAGKGDLNLHPGQVLHFLLAKDNTLTTLVLPQGKDQQVRFSRPNAATDFTVVHESYLNHVSADDDAQHFTQAVEMPSAKAAAKARQARQEAQLMVAKAAADEKANAVTDPLRPRLIYGTLQPGENFKRFAKRIGLTSSEVNTIERLYAKNGKLSALSRGDSVRVLFNAIGTSALINAVEIQRQGSAKVTFYRNLDDKNFYEENKYVPTAGVFRRFPLAIAIQVNSKFNLHRRHPVTGRVAPHKGVDIKAPIGTPVYAPADGVVTFAGYQRAAGYYIIVRHEHNYSTVYMHLSKIEVKKGQQVYVGQQIAKSGNTGRTTGPHLHYEIRINDRPVDPLKIKLPSASRPNLAREQREAFKSNVQVFKTELYNEALAQNP